MGEQNPLKLCGVKLLKPRLAQAHIEPIVSDRELEVVDVDRYQELMVRGWGEVIDEARPNQLILDRIE